VYETLVAWEFEERAECNDCGREYPVTEMIDIGRQGTGYECELCNERGVEN
jgi:formate dehydrogenase maturation protein FdhE